MSNKFSDKIKDKTQLQRLLGRLNYIFKFYKNLAQDANPSFQKLKKNPLKWSIEHTLAKVKLFLALQSLILKPLR